jgi:hypothetical protein
MRKQAFPLAFIEFIETDYGKTIREGPRNEKEEAFAHERWKVISSSVSYTPSLIILRSKIEKQRNLSFAKLWTRSLGCLKSI